MKKRSVYCVMNCGNELPTPEINVDPLAPAPLEICGDCQVGVRDRERELHQEVVANKRDPEYGFRDGDDKRKRSDQVSNRNYQRVAHADRRPPRRSKSA